MKKSQITLIIAIALFIVIIAALIFYVANYYKNKTPIEPLVFERASIENYVNNCVKKTAEDGLRQFGNPVGSYFYNDKDLRKDFVINIPKESSTYKLCLRKNSAQQFKDYNGLVDFVDKKIELNGIVNYLRYPLRNNQIASLLSDFVYRGLKNVKTLLNYDTDLLFLNNVNIKNVLNNNQQISITKPNNYFIIKEIELENGKIHRVVELNKITKNQLTQDINYNYESDNLEPKVIINNGVFIQDNGKNRITILPQKHSKIGSFLK